MVYDFVVSVKNERRKAIDRISILVILLSASAFIMVLVSGLSGSTIFIAAAAILITGIVVQLLRARKQVPVSYVTLIVIAGITWLAMPFLPWIGFPVLLLSLIEKPAKMPLEIGFTHDHIIINNLFRKKYAWQVFTNILLKDGILTLDFRNNRVFQKETIDAEGDAEEDEFNDYCKARLREAYESTNFSMDSAAK